MLYSENAKDILTDEYFKDISDDMSYVVNFESSPIITKRAFESLFSRVKDVTDIYEEKIKSYQYPIDMYNFIDVTNEKVNASSEITSIDTLYSNNILANDRTYTLTTPSKTRKVTSEFNISCDTNGFIGNTRRGYFSDGDIVFVGDDNPMIDLSKIESTMCCFELIDGESANEYMYDDGVYFTSKDGYLYVNLTITLKNTSDINTISFSDSMCPRFIIDEVSLIDEHDNILSSSKTLSNFRNVFTFKKTKTKKIVIKTRTVSATSSNIVKGLKQTVGPLSSINMHIKNSKAVVNDVTNIDNRSQYEIFKDFKKQLEVRPRYSICIGNLEMTSCEYNSQGSFTKKINTKNNIKKVSFICDEIIEKDHTVKYSVSIDNTIYTEISPINRASGNEIHTINLVTSSRASNPGTKNVIINKKEKSFYIKLELESKDIDSTPVVSNIFFDIEEE